MDQDSGPSWLTFFRHASESLWSIALFLRKCMLRKVLSSLIAIGRCTRQIVACNIASSNFDQKVFCSVFAVGTPVVKASSSLCPDHDPPFSRHQHRRKLLDLDRTQRLAIFPRAPPFTERRIRTRRRNHYDPSNCGAIDRETEQAALKNNRTLFLMSRPLCEIRSSRINSETVLGHAESQNSGRKRNIREELQTLFAA